MKYFLATGGLLALLLACTLRADEPKLQSPLAGSADSGACHGTAVPFVATPVEAARLAAEEKKLVFVLHVSGYFEDPNFT